MMTYTTNILLLSQVENLLPQPLYSFEFADYFFLEFTATTSTHTCVFFKLFMQQLKRSPSSRTSILILITLSMYNGKHLQISQKIHTLLDRFSTTYTPTFQRESYSSLVRIILAFSPSLFHCHTLRGDLYPNTTHTFLECRNCFEA